MTRNLSLNISSILTLLFGGILLFLIGILAVDGADTWRALSSARRAEVATQASRNVFAAMQTVSLERGSTRRLLLLPAGADAPTAAKLADWRRTSSDAVERFTRVCGTAACAGLGTDVADIRAVMGKLEAMRGEVDAALALAPEQRRKSLLDDWMAAATAATDQLAKTSKAILEPTRAIDSTFAELIGIKDTGMVVRQASTLMRLALDTVLRTKTVTAKEEGQMAQARGQLDASWRLLTAAGQHAGVPAPVRTAIAAAADSYVTAYLRAHDATVAALAAGQALPIPLNIVNDTADRGMTDLDAIANAAVDALAIHAGAREGTATASLAADAAILALALLLGAAGLAIVRRRVTGPMRRITDAMLRVAEGDLSGAVPHRDRKDEIGALAGTLLVFKENAAERERIAASQDSERRLKEQRAAAVERLVRGFDKAVTAALQTVSASAGQLEATAHGLSDTASQTNERAATTATAAEQACGNVQTVATATEELTASITEISQQVSRSASIANDAMEQAHRANGEVTGLVEQAQRIGDVLRLITSIANQTNLLALNATIEAARAGEAGKGFAVVASEVKNLANQTAKATEEIAAQIAAMQGASAAAAQAINGIGSTIGVMNEIATSIASAIEEQGAATAEIARNVQQAAVGTQLVTTNIVDVSRAVTETGSAATQLLSAADALSRESGTLKADVEDFLENIRAA